MQENLLLEEEILLPEIIPRIDTEFYKPFHHFMDITFQSLISQGYNPQESRLCLGGFMLFQDTGKHMYENASDSMIIRRAIEGDSFKPKCILKSWLNSDDIYFTISDNGMGLRHPENSKYKYHSYGVRGGRNRALKYCERNIQLLSGSIIKKIGESKATFGFQVPISSLEYTTYSALSNHR